MDNEKYYEKKIAELVAEKEFVDSMLKTLNDYSREIVKKRFIEKWEVWKIAQNEGKSEDAIKKTIGKSTEYLENKYNEIKVL